jgi:hypothetical protein
MDREHTEQTALGRTGEVNHLACRTQQLHRAEHPDGEFALRHPQSVAHAVTRK